MSSNRKIKFVLSKMNITNSYIRLKIRKPIKSIIKIPIIKKIMIGIGKEKKNHYHLNIYGNMKIIIINY